MITFTHPPTRGWVGPLNLCREIAEVIRAIAPNANFDLVATRGPKKKAKRYSCHALFHKGTVDLSAVRALWLDRYPGEQWGDLAQISTHEFVYEYGCTNMVEPGAFRRNSRSL